MNRMNKLTGVLLIIAFWTILLIPVLLTNRKEHAVSEVDNRELAEKPSFRSEESMAVQWDNYLRDRIGFRNQFLTQNQIWNARLFGYMDHPLYEFGKDKYVFFRYANDFQWDNPEYIDLFSRAMVVPQQLCDEFDCCFRMWINPSKKVIYQEYMSDGVRLNTDNTDLLLQELDSKKIKYTYTKDALLNARSSLQVFNRQYDAGHWNDAGAFTGTVKLLNDLKNDGYDLKIPEPSDYWQKDVRQKTLPVSSFPIDEITQQWVPYHQQAVKTDQYDDRIRAVISVEHPAFSCFRNDKNPDAPRLLLFHGSYLAGREWFLADSFSEVMSVEGYGNIQNIWKYFEIFQPDIVVFECADYAVSPELYPEDMLHRMVGETPQSGGSK